MNGMIKVGMADLNVISSPGVLTTLGLGSCVGIALYDAKNKVAGLAHIMLPSGRMVGDGNQNKAKFADTAIDSLLSIMLGMGAKQGNMIAKLAGGAQMFASRNGASDILKIGQKNTEQTLRILEERGITVVAQDTGGSYGRTIELYAETGILIIKTIGHGIKHI